MIELIGTSAAVAKAKITAKLFAENDKVVCGVVGPLGSGKMHAARYIHSLSMRSDKPFVDFSPDGNKDADKLLFGDLKSSIIGKDIKIPGLIEKAGKGFLLISEPQRLLPESQLKLAAAIELGEYSQSGAKASLKTECRFIFSLANPPKKLVDDKRLVPELAWLFERNLITIPPLKERSSDILPLSEYFVSKWCRELNVRQKQLSKRAQKLLSKFSWPENVAQLQKVLLNAVVFSKNSEIDTNDLELHIDGNFHHYTDSQLDQVALEDIVERKLKLFMQRLGKYDVTSLHDAIITRVEKPLLKLVMDKAEGNQLRAARILGINRNTLRTKLLKHGIKENQ